MLEEFKGEHKSEKHNSISQKAGEKRQINFSFSLEYEPDEKGALHSTVQQSLGVDSRTVGQEPVEQFKTVANAPVADAVQAGAANGRTGGALGAHLTTCHGGVSGQRLKVLLISQGRLQLAVVVVVVVVADVVLS